MHLNVPLGVGYDNKPFAEHPHPAVSADVLNRIQDLQRSGMPWEAAIRQTRKQMFPPWYSPCNWRQHTGIWMGSRS